MKLGAKELRTAEPSPQDLLKIKRNPIYIVLDNVLDTYNVGSIFRLADAVAAEKIFLCGETETPPNPKIKKASVDTWRWVPWEYCKSAVEAIAELRSGKWEVGSGISEVRKLDDLKSGETNLTSKKSKYPTSTSRISHFAHRTSIQVIAIEQHPRSISYDKADYHLPLAVVVGNETYGVSKEVLKMADQIVEIPMWGVNKSLNVMVSLGIVLYQVMGKCLP